MSYCKFIFYFLALFFGNLVNFSLNFGKKIFFKKSFAFLSLDKLNVYLNIITLR